MTSILPDSEKPSRPVHLPSWVIALVVLLTATPFLLNLFGVDCSSGASTNGAILHGFFEWSATVTAVIIAVLALTHFRITGHPLTPVIGLALLGAGVVDGLHILVADGFIQTVAGNDEFLPLAGRYLGSSRPSFPSSLAFQFSYSSTVAGKQRALRWFCCQPYRLRP